MTKNVDIEYVFEDSTLIIKLLIIMSISNRECIFNFVIDNINRNTVLSLDIIIIH